MRENTNTDKDQAQAPQIVGTYDLAETLKGEEGRFLANTPGGDILLADSKPGHSITSLRIIPKPQVNGFNVVKVARFADRDASTTDDNQQRGRSAGTIQMVPVAD